MLATVQQQFDRKNNKRNYRKNCFNSILIKHKIVYDAVMKKTHPLPLSPCWKVKRAMPPLCGVPAYSYQQPMSHCIICQDVMRSTVTCGKTPNIVTWSEHYRICCHVIITQSRPTVKQSARKFGNLPLQPKERTWVNCKLTTAWHQNCKSRSCAVWVSYRQINWYCKK